MNTLKQEGFIERVHGKDMFVLKTLDENNKRNSFFYINSFIKIFYRYIFCYMVINLLYGSECPEELKPICLFIPIPRTIISILLLSEIKLSTLLHSLSKSSANPLKKHIWFSEIGSRSKKLL